MAFTLDQIVPWGRSYAEYVAMFGLMEVDLAQRVLGCGDGPAAFNAELTRHGGRVVSVDPIYAFTAEQIERRIGETCNTVLAQLHANQGDYVWESIPSVEELGQVRLAAMKVFLADYESGKQAGRYAEGELPVLPFGDDSFDLALSSHFLFLYSAHLSAEFHIQAIREMLRVAGEVRIFPLLALDGTRSPHLPAVMDALSAAGCDAVEKPVAYEFQRGGNQMLRIRRAP